MFYNEAISSKFQESPHRYAKNLLKCFPSSFSMASEMADGGIPREPATYCLHLLVVSSLVKVAISLTTQFTNIAASAVQISL